MYFQQDVPDEDESFDYFKGSYVGSTSKTEKQTYRLSVNNDFQAKIRGEKDNYSKSTFLSWNASISYDALKDSLNFSEMNSNIKVKNLSGDELFRIKMYHSFYKLDEVEQKPINEMVNIWAGENPRLTRMDIYTDMKIKLLGTTTRDILQTTTIDSTDDIEDEFYSAEQEGQSENLGNNIWESKLQFTYSTKWKYTDEEWDYKFSLKTINSINLSKNWALTYMADFNLKEREMTYHSFRIYRPLHCWVFNFKWYPGVGPDNYGNGFQLLIKVKNPDLQDIRLKHTKGNMFGF